MIVRFPSSMSFEQVQQKLTNTRMICGTCQHYIKPIFFCYVKNLKKVDIAFCNKWEPKK